MQCNLETVEISQVLNTLKSMLSDRNTRLNICENREKNYIFYYLYNIDKNQVRQMLNELEVVDFKYITQNSNPNYPKSDLYVFSKTVVLTNAIGEEAIMELYIKFSLDEKNKRIITISFHEAEHSFISKGDIINEKIL